MIHEIHLFVTADLVDNVCDILNGHGSMGMVVDIVNGRAKPLIKGYFEQPEKVQIAVELQLMLVAMGRKSAELSLDWFEVEEGDWESAWKVHAKPVPTGQRLLILPSWLSPDADNDRQILRMDPEMAFGSGSHETTRGCLESLERVADLVGLGSLLDMGTGSGILAIGAVLLGADRVMAIDNDPIAVETAEKNAQINRVEKQIAFLQAAEVPDGPFSTVVVNILAEVLLTMRDPLINSLALDGYLILSGILLEQSKEVVDSYLERNLFHVDSLVMGEWVTLIFNKKGTGL
ncbi:MAG: 50S ribosomal protein L11 methyltransferase [Magnetococcales bacterium]|nr:50S ribosomal protein L11 methyltransferase [Magnetococcales bacterium]